MDDSEDVVARAKSVAAAANAVVSQEKERLDAAKVVTGMLGMPPAEFLKECTPFLSEGEVARMQQYLDWLEDRTRRAIDEVERRALHASLAPAVEEQRRSPPKKQFI